MVELEALAEAYGVDFDDLTDDPISIAEDDMTSALTSLEEFRELGDSVCLSLVRSTNAVRTLGELRAPACQPTGLGRSLAPPRTSPTRSSTNRDHATPYP